MTLSLALTLAGVGFLGAFCSGLLGIGGALVMFPLLLYVPPLVGVGQLDVKAVVGVTMALVFVAAVSGTFAHSRQHATNRQLITIGGFAGAVGSFVGALASKAVDDRWLLLVFAALATVGAVLILMPGDVAQPAAGGETMRFSPVRVALVAGGVGFAAGFVGAGGGFLLVPLLVVVVGVPMRVTIGSSLGITALAATAGFVGKLVTHQIPFLPALTVVLGAIPGAQLGAMVSRRVSTRHLKLVLSITIVLAAVRVWWDVFGPVALLALPVGFTLGLVVGVTGMGSGLLIAPLSYAIFGLDYPHAVALAVIYSVFARAFGMVNFRHWGIDGWRLVLSYGLAGAAGSVVGSRLIYAVNESIGSAFPFLLGGTLGVVGLLVVLDTLVSRSPRPAGGDSPEADTSLAKVRVAAVQLFVGLLVGLTAIGSGSLVRLSQNRLFRVPEGEDLGAALAIALMMLIPAGVTHVALSNVDWRFVGLLTAGSMVGTVLSPAAARTVPKGAVPLVMAALVMVGGILTVLRALTVGGS